MPLASITVTAPSLPNESAVTPPCVCAIVAEQVQRPSVATEVISGSEAVPGPGSSLWPDPPDPVPAQLTRALLDPGRARAAGHSAYREFHQVSEGADILGRGGAVRAHGPTPPICMEPPLPWCV
ncbi:MAG: hypothetical protein ACRDNF_25090 [Streptosporangiaceae bacterium]